MSSIDRLRIIGVLRMGYEILQVAPRQVGRVPVSLGLVRKKRNLTKREVLAVWADTNGLVQSELFAASQLADVTDAQLEQAIGGL